MIKSELPSKNASFEHFHHQKLDNVPILKGFD
jgi:hypothetical protein